jgi:hypothetical protein
MKAEQRTIDGVGYTCTQMPAMTAVRVMTRLAKMIGEPVVRLVADMFAEDKGEKKMTVKLPSLKKIMLSVSELFIGLDEDIVQLTIEDMFRGKGLLTCDNIAEQGIAGDVFDQFDIHFAGRMGHLLKVIQFGMEVNFRDFFDVLPLTTGEGSPEEDTRE